MLTRISLSGQSVPLYSNFVGSMYQNYAWFEELQRFVPVNATAIMLIQNNTVLKLRVLHEFSSRHLTQIVCVPNIST